MIHNPDNLSPDQIGEGYRIATTVDDASLSHEFFSAEWNRWISASHVKDTFAFWTGRTNRVPETSDDD